jgi:hypothetical protein
MSDAKGDPCTMRHEKPSTACREALSKALDENLVACFPIYFGKKLELPGGQNYCIDRTQPIV